MRKSLRSIIFLFSRIIAVLSALFSGVNLLFIHLGNGRLMPMALSMTGYLAKTGIQMASDYKNVFFSIYSTVLAGVVCAALLLCTVMAGRNTGWMTAGAIVFLCDCVGMAMLILQNGYRSGYWFEIVGHVLILIAYAIALCTAPSYKKRKS